MLENKKIAIVYDWIDKWGGVERVLLMLHEMFPKATFYTSYFNEEKAFWAKNFKINTSFIQQLPNFIKNNRLLSLPFYPFAFEQFNFNQYDLVISVTSSFAKAIITKPSTKHICYLLTPTRFLWSHCKEYGNNDNFYAKYLKNWDKTAAQRPDKIISISETVKDRCKQYYKRDSDVIYPPFDIDYWNDIKSKIKDQRSKPKLKTQNYFLVVSRLELYKQIDLVVEAFNQLTNQQLVVVGMGSLENRLKDMAKNSIKFVPYVSDSELASLYSNAKALIMPQEEDFGYVSLEAQFFGCPVISYKKGGATETIVNNKTGIFFNEQNKQSLRQALERYHAISYNLRTSTRKFGIKNIERFDKAKFVEQFKSFL